MAWEVTWQTTKKPWMDHPDARWNAGLKAAGLNWRTGLSRSHYPPLRTVKRTYATADKAGFRIVEEGHIMEFGSTAYLPFILNGTVKWEGWPGKKHGLISMMGKGFRAGIRNYEG